MSTKTITPEMITAVCDHITAVWTRLLQADPLWKTSQMVDEMGREIARTKGIRHYPLSPTVRTRVIVPEVPMEALIAGACSPEKKAVIETAKPMVGLFANVVFSEGKMIARRYWGHDFEHGRHFIAIDRELCLWMVHFTRANPEQRTAMLEAQQAKPTIN